MPYLLGGDGLSLGDSFAIAREADRLGDGALVPVDLLDEITTWNERSERLMRAGRARILVRTEESRDVQIESLPPHLPRALRGVLAPTVRIGTAYLRKKYDVRPVTDEDLEPDLAAIRAAIAGDPIAAAPRTLHACGHCDGDGAASRASASVGARWAPPRATGSVGTTRARLAMGGCPRVA